MFLQRRRSAAPAAPAVRSVLTPWRRARPVLEGAWGTSCVAVGVALVATKAALAGAAGLSAVAVPGLLANLALIGGGLMFLREARRHTVAERGAPREESPPESELRT